MEWIVGAALVALVIAGLKRRPRGRRSPSRRPPSRRPGGASSRTGGRSSSTQTLQRRPYPGDFTGKVIPEYSPVADSRPDPGEVVWTWVPFEDNPAEGKDRPVLLIGRHGSWLLGLMLSSKDHDVDAADEARWGRRWMDIGAGAWDAKRRPSEVRLDRVVRVHPDDVRRVGAILDRQLFQRITRSL